jgi:hypothetical protein
MAQRLELDIVPRPVMGKANKRLRKAGIIEAASTVNEAVTEETAPTTETTE